MAIPTQDDLVLATEDVWLAFLHRAPHVAPHVTSLAPGDACTLAGVVQITGEWTGAITVQMPSGLAERLAGSMFRLTTRMPTIDEQVDALGEITNMIGGRLKSLLDGPCQLSLPAVVAGGGYQIRMPGGRTLTDARFECEDHAFVVSVVATAGERPA